MILSLLKNQSHSQEKGFSLLETLVSLVIFGIASVAMAKGFTTHLTTNTRTEQHSAAVMAAQQVLDTLRTQDPTSMQATGSTTQNITIGTRTFSVVTRYCSQASYCTSTNIRHLRVEVSYRNTLMYTVETIYAQLR